MKKVYLFVLFSHIIVFVVRAGPMPDVSYIPDLEAPIALPTKLIGEFVFPRINRSTPEGWQFYVIQIHENNKFLWHRLTSGHTGSSDQGYVIFEDGDYYFVPSEGYWGDRNFHIMEKTKITFTENGFSFIGRHNVEFIAVRRREDTE